MSQQPFHILLPSDVFPPRCGGAGWSAHALALALIERGHAVQALVPQQGRSGAAREDVLGVPTLRWGYRAPRIPFIQNYFRHERLWPRLAELLVELATTDDRQPTTDIAKQRSVVGGQWSVVSGGSSIVIHAQHVQVAPPSVMAGRRLGVPVVVTVRDHWPWDYFATGLHGDRMPFEHQTWATLATDLSIRLGQLPGALALPAIPYLLAHLRRRQQFLRQADAVIAVSDYIARRLAGIVAPERLHVIPNMLDLAAIDAATAESPASVAPSTPYLLYVGKLERNKGAHLLIDIFRELKRLLTIENRASILYPLSSILYPPQLVIAGSGSLRPELERELTALGVQVRLLDWIDHDETLRLMAHCQLLLFPSSWGEPLSRVLLEGMACGAPILAMPTGGTPSALRDGVDGALEPTPAGFARRMATLLARPEQRAALGAAARRIAQQRYAKEMVVRQVEALYAALKR